MKGVAVVTVVLLASVVSPAFAHRTDEYLQATTIAVEKNRVAVELRLAPGVAVLRTVLTEIDTNGDGAITDAEQRTYAERVARDLSLSVDGVPVPLRVVSASAAPIADLREGLGEMHLAFAADLPPRDNARTLHFENRHLPRISAYLVNGLVPRDPDLHITAQARDSLQSSIDLTYIAASGSVSFATALEWLLFGGAAAALVWQLGSDRREKPGTGGHDVPTPATS